MPMARTRPNSEMLLRLKFKNGNMKASPIVVRAAMTASVPMMETGTSMRGRIIARQSWRKTNTTRPTNMTASNRVTNTSQTESRMYGVVS